MYMYIPITTANRYRTTPYLTTPYYSKHFFDQNIIIGRQTPLERSIISIHCCLTSCLSVTKKLVLVHSKRIVGLRRVDSIRQNVAVRIFIFFL